MGYLFSTLDFAGLVTTDVLCIVSTSDHSLLRYFHLLHLSDATLRRVLMFSESASYISYDQMSRIEITPDAIFISLDNQLHTYGNYLCCYLLHFDKI